jgi:hypothetical protein
MPSSIGLGDHDPQMQECSEIGLMLGAAGDGELEPDDLQQVAHHLERCASCTGELSDYSTIGRQLRAMAAVPSLEGFTKSVLAAIATLIAVAIFAVAMHGNPNTGNVARAVPDAITSRPPARSPVAAPVAVVDVQVDSAFVGDTAFGSFSHTNGRTESGKMIVFRLPEGKTLHVMPRAIDGGMIAMEVVLFDGERPTMTAELKLGSGDTFAVGGEKYGEGTLLIRISPTTAASASPGPPLS